LPVAPPWRTSNCILEIKLGSTATARFSRISQNPQQIKSQSLVIIGIEVERATITPIFLHHMGSPRF
jgi:hypothetical protein